MIWFNAENNLALCMPNRVWKQITKLCNKHFPNECGGVLIGNYNRTFKTANVKGIFISKRNKANRYSLIREAAETNKFLKTLWVVSFKKKYFIGEWHSHPNGNNVPSLIDDESSFKIAQNKKCECSRSALIILCGNREVGWKADSAWLYTREGRRLELVVKKTKNHLTDAKACAIIGL